VRIASSVLSAKDLFLFNPPLAKSTLEAMRTQGQRLDVFCEKPYIARHQFKSFTDI